MGNCCATQKPKGFVDESKRPIRFDPSVMTVDSASVNTRPSTPGGEFIIDNDKKDGKVLVKLDSSPNVRPGHRINYLNQLEAMPRRDPPSQPNSVKSSTIPGEETSKNSGFNKTGLGMSPPSSSLMVGTIMAPNRKSVMSAVSEFKQDSVDLDEQIANAEAIKELKKNKALPKATPAKVSKGKETKLDLSIPQEPRKMIYQITNDFPVQRPYSVTSDWQRVLEKYSISQQAFINDKPVDTNYDALAESILALSNRNWIRDQLKIHMENRMAQQDSLSNLVKQKQALQLREHFTWIVWAVAQYYFGAPERANGQGEEFDNNQFHSRATIPDQDVSAFEDQESQMSYNSRLNTQKLNQSSAINSSKPQTGEVAKSKTFFTCKLPKTNSQKWSEGFAFKGVFFRLLPYEDASYVLDEMKALRAVQTDLLDLKAQEQAYLSQQQEYTGREGTLGPGVSLQGSFAEGRLHKDIILPFLAGVKCCGFYLYGTPLIYTQEVKGDEKKSVGFKDNLLGSMSNSIVNLDSEMHISDDIIGFSLPRFSSVCPPAGTGFENFETLNRRGTFNYLHENIDEETLRDPVMQRMPLLKNVSRRNLIPVIDFEEFNNGKDIYSSAVSNNSGIPASFQISYLAVYLSSVLRSLSQESAASVLFTLPNSASEDIVFQPYPLDNTIEINELEKMFTFNTLPGPGNISLKPLGDREEVKSQKLFPETEFNRKFMSKHGWHCFLIEKRARDMQSQFSMRGVNDNKRATTFFSLRENSAGGLEQLFTAKESAMSIIIEGYEPNSTPHNAVETPKNNPFRKAGISENLESTPRMKMNLAPGGQNSATRASQHIFISPNKKTIMKRQEVNKEDFIHGNVVVAAVYKRGFKVLSSLSQHSYANGIETMFQLSLEQVAKILDSSDRVSNMDALKDLMHRKGLNLRFLWALLTKVKLKMSRDLIMASILLRTMRKIINEEVKLGSCIMKAASQIPFMQSSGGLLSGASNFYRRSSNSNSAASTPFQKAKFTPKTGQLSDPDHYQGNRWQLFRECLTLFANAVMKNKFAKYKQVFDEALLGLFLSRLKILPLAHQLDLSQSQMNYLESKDIVDHVLEMPSQNPIMFLNAMQTYFNLDYKKEFTRLYRQDKYYILNKPQPIGRSDITRINQNVQTYFSLREQAYFILARKISHNQRLRAARIKHNQEHAERENVSLSKVFQRPSNRALDTSNQSFDQTQTDRLNNADETPRIGGSSNPRMNNFMNTGKGGKQSKLQKSGDTHRKFQNLQSQQSIANSSGLYQNIIDLSRTKRNHFRPARCGEILLPANLYKLYTNANDQKSNSVQELFTNNSSSVFQPYYEMPNADVLNEWVIVLESLLHEVYSVQGCEAVLLEALSYQCIMTLFLEQDSDSSFKILAKVRDLLHQAFVCPPELVLMSMTLMGVWQDMNEEIDQFPIESEKHYIAALITAFQIYGDPRGRGNYSVPFYLFFAWKLSLLSLADGKKINDSELSEELFDSTLISLFNHKRIYKNCQMELVLAQEQAHQNKLNQNPSTGTLPTINNLNSSTLIRNGQLLHFEMMLDQQEVKNSQFNMRKYRKRHKNVVTAGGFVKPSNPTPAPLVAAANKLGDRSNQTGIKPYQQTLANGTKLSESPAQSINHLQKNNYDLEISDLDIEIKIEDDFDRQRLAALNFRESETVVGKTPFPHWTINRQIIQSQSNMLAGERPSEAKQMQKEMVRDQLTKSVDMEALFPWIVTYNPIMSCSGLRWDAQTIKEVVFGQNSQINGTSEPSSMTFSSHKMSQYSYRSNSERGSKTRRAFLNPYSTYIGKEVGGIQKGEILGQLYSWGTDQFGQLGLEYFVTNKMMGSLQSLKVLHPRIVVPLKDELIKEICCGYAHTLAINQFGQMYSWGFNESGQLGIGNENVPNVVRKPVLNNFINNVAKLAAGHEHSLALTKTQDLYVWGTGSLTGLGIEENIGIPTLFEFFTKAKSEAPLSSQTNKISQIACGGLHTAVVTKDGELFTWGSTEGGQLGHEMNSDEPSVKKPTRVEFLASRGLKISQVSCGEAHTVVLTTEDQVWGWGMSMYGQLGLGYSGDSFEPGEGMEKSKVTVPTEITQYMPPEITVAKIICGAAFTMFLTTENELYGCGINDLGQLGLDTYLEEMQIAVLDRARQAAGGIRDAITSDVTVPSRVICFEGLKVNSVSCGESHSLALIGEEKSLWAWGMYRNGQLGLGEVNQKMNPRPVQTLHTANVHKLAAGSQHSLALLGDSNQLTAMAANFFLNSDLLTNPWAIDCRRLTTEDSKSNRKEISLAQKPMV